MNAHDDAMIDNVALLALGALTPPEAAATRAHLLGCETCAVEYRRFRSVTAVLPLTAELAQQEAAPGPLLKRRILASTVQAPAKRPALWTSVLAAACLLLAVLFGALFAATLQRANVQQTTLADLISPASQRYPVRSGEVLRHGERLYIALRNLPPPPPGKVYQAWTLAAGAKHVDPSVVFVPSGDAAVVRLPVDARKIAAVAVSVEPDGGSRQPTSKPLFLRPL